MAATIVLAPGCGGPAAAESLPAEELHDTLAPSTCSNWTSPG